MIKRLSDIADIQAGYSFRGSIKHDKDASVKVVQAKDISDLGELLSNNLVKTEPTGKKQPTWLQEGDILFIAKGLRHFACCILEGLEKTTCAPSLFIIRIKPELTHSVSSTFLAWQLNQKPIQNYFRKSAEGSIQINIRKAVLSDVELAIPSIEKQNSIAKLHIASLRENALLKQLIDNRQQQLHAIASDLLKNSTEN